MNKEKRIDIVDFIRLAEINRKYCLDNCEYEVSQNAMMYYLKFQVYKNWGLIKDERKKGAFLLQEKSSGYYLTADILTSIRKPIEIVTGQTINLTGEYIINSILNCQIGDSEKFLLNNGKRGNSFQLKIKKELQSSIKAFSTVYYWIGNMIPTGSNYSPGCQNNDTWAEKLREVLSIFEDTKKWEEGSSTFTVLSTKPGIKEKQKKRWPAWITYCWKSSELEKFICDNYLNDLIIKNNGKVTIKDIISLESISDEKEKNCIQWFLVNTKIIIQRSYRIVFDFKGDWDSSLTDKENVETLIEYVFQNAGVKDNSALF